MVAPGSLVLESEEMVELLWSDTNVREHMIQALERMTRFYAENDYWLERGDHNHLRITRILKSSCILGLRDEAINFYHFIIQRVESAQPVTKESLAYWHHSISPVSLSSFATLNPPLTLSIRMYHNSTAVEL